MQLFLFGGGGGSGALIEALRGNSVNEIIRATWSMKFRFDQFEAVGLNVCLPNLWEAGSDRAFRGEFGQYDFSSNSISKVLMMQFGFYQFE